MAVPAAICWYCCQCSGYVPCKSKTGVVDSGWFKNTTCPSQHVLTQSRHIYIYIATFLFHLKTLGPWPLRCLGYFGHTCCDDEGLECSPVIPCLLGKVTWTMGGNRRVIDVHLKFPNFQSPGRVEDCSLLNHRIHPLQAIAKSLSMQLGSCVTSPMSSVASCRYLQTVWAAGFSKCRLW